VDDVPETWRTDHAFTASVAMICKLATDERWETLRRLAFFLEHLTDWTPEGWKELRSGRAALTARVRGGLDAEDAEIARAATVGLPGTTTSADLVAVRDRLLAISQRNPEALGQFVDLVTNLLAKGGELGKADTRPEQQPEQDSRGSSAS
jgi:hypothetical protein